MLAHQTQAFSALACAAMLSTVSHLITAQTPAAPTAPQPAPTRSADVSFATYDGHPMLGRLTLPADSRRHPVVIYVQSAEGMTRDMRRPLSDSTTFDYMSLYATRLPEMGVGFFSYEGRGITGGTRPPRFETIDSAVFNTSTLENKTRDLLSAIDVVRKQPGVDPQRILLLGASEGTLLIAMAAARQPRGIAALVMYGVLAEPLPATFRYIMTDGAFLMYRRSFDTDGDGRITQAEFDADPKHFRQRALGGTTLAILDINHDGVFSAEDIAVRTKRWLDAIDARDFDTLQLWARGGSAVSLPTGWFKDHFSQPPMWEFVKGLDMPIGLFQGDGDAMTPIASVRGLQQRATEAGKTNLEFHFFEGLDHSLSIGRWFVRGVLPEGHAALFAFIDRVTKDAR